MTTFQLGCQVVLSLALLIVYTVLTVTGYDAQLVLGLLGGQLSGVGLNQAAQAAKPAK